MDTSKFRGTWTALITPFTDSGEIDWQSLQRLVERQIEGGVTGILVIGTTGESPSFTDEESRDIITKTKEMIDGRCLLMAGCGTNCTATTLKKTAAASACGPDCLLVVNPYYNKPTQEGLYLHFKAVADSTELPVFLYNIKGRTGVNLETSTLHRLATECPNIIGVKEASGDLDQIADVCATRPDGFVVLSGDDGITYQIMSENNADGVVSVASNIIPEKVVQMVNELDSDLNDKLQDFFDGMFVETNPIPVKYSAHKMGLCGLNYRLPMCPPSEGAQAKTDALLAKYELI